MQVRLLCGGQYAYACIKHSAGSMDVQLQPGRSAQKSLQESAQENRDKAARLLRHAELMEQAAGLL